MGLGEPPAKRIQHSGQYAKNLGEIEQPLPAVGTGLDLTDQDGSLREELLPITQFLNRVLALQIAMQNLLFAAMIAALLRAAIYAIIGKEQIDGFFAKRLRGRVVLES